MVVGIAGSDAGGALHPCCHFCRPLLLAVRGPFLFPASSEKGCLLGRFKARVGDVIHGGSHGHCCDSPTSPLKDSTVQLPTRCLFPIGFTKQSSAIGRFGMSIRSALTLLS